MLNKLKLLLKKIKYYFSHEYCYREMEQQGIAVFGMCKGTAGGDVYTDYLSYQCVDCPYLTLTDRSDNNA